MNPSLAPRRFEHLLIASAVLCLAIGLAGPARLAADNDALPQKLKAAEPTVKEKGDEGEESINFVTASGTGVGLSGNKAAFQRRSQTSKDFSGGIKEFLFEDKLAEDELLTIGGHGLFDVHDYDFKLNYEVTDVGHVEIGYKEFRTFYNGSGGYDPVTTLWFSLQDSELHVDRAEVWFEAQLALPDLPVFTFKYEHRSRQGQKDSLTWGSSSVYPNQMFNGRRYIAPAFMNLNQSEDVFEGDLKHTIDNTTVESGLAYELNSENDGHYFMVSPGQTAERYSSQHEVVTRDLFTYHLTSETWFTDKLMMASAYAYDTMNTHNEGDMSQAQGQFDSPVMTTRNHLNLNGGTHWDQHSMCGNFLFLPSEDWAITPTVRFKTDKADSRSAVDTPNAQQDTRSTSTWMKLAEQLEATYKGISDWVFFVRGDWEQNQNTLNENQNSNVSRVNPILNANNRITQADILAQKYTAGANWYPSRSVSVGGQYYHRQRANKYNTWDEWKKSATTGLDSTNPAYSAFITDQRFYSDDWDYRLSWRMLNNLTSVTRYDAQVSRIESAFSGLGAQMNGQTESHTIGETLTWNPFDCLFLQGGMNYMIDSTWTPASNLSGTNMDSLFPTSENNWWSGNFSAGYSFNEKTDLQTTYYYYRADNYQDETVSQPYDSGAEEHSVTVALKRQIAADILWTLSYGFLKGRDQNSGGHNNYDAHIVSTDVRFQF